MGEIGARRVTTLPALLRLARVSNLPTVWSNVLAASVLAGGLSVRGMALTLFAMSAMYTGGMILNDAFDREIDARERPLRPIPSGAISTAVAWSVGLACLVTGVITLAAFGAKSAGGGIALAAAILLYDAWHKGNPLSPLIMGTCRALVYIGTALAAGTMLSGPILYAALALLLYIAGLTRAAKGGAFRDLASSWPLILLLAPLIVALASGSMTAASMASAVAALAAVGWAIALLRSQEPGQREAAIGLLIATIALMDGVVAAAHGKPDVAFVCAGLFVVTLLAQRFVPGT